MALKHFDIRTWKEAFNENIKKDAVTNLENGKVLYFPSLPFSLNPDELSLLSPDVADPKSKNVSYELGRDRLNGVICSDEQAQKLKLMLKRYAVTSRQFLESLIPHYTRSLIQGKTSFRPVEILGRKTSYRKDDTRLHVDSFPSNPTKGQRILRIFTNINPTNKPRVWRLGEPFEDVIEKMLPRVSRPIWGVANLYKLLRITKDLRTPYDHYMLNIHDAMKKDDAYQKDVSQTSFEFPAGSSWMVYTDQVSHAAMAGQYVLEQTFYLPADGIKNPATSPLRVLEKRLDQVLV